MNRLTLSVLLWALCLVAVAQGSVRGTVTDRQTGEAMQFVNVVVHTAAGKIAAGGMTDEAGKFNITGLADGQYRLEVSFLGYQTVKRQFALTPRNRRVTYADIVLAEDRTLLKEVTVTGQRSQMKLEVDRKTFTVDQVLAAAGGTASELLEQIPSVEVTTDGEISLRGNSSVEVWINGKASGLTSENRGEILQQIPAESIERIEVIDNPSAKYSPEGSAGIINIILKRDRRAGYYGSAQAGANHKGGWNMGGNINYSASKIEAFANLGYRQRRGSGGSRSEQQYLNTQTYQNSQSADDNRGRNLFARGGLTFHLTGKDNLSLTGMTLQGRRNDRSTSTYRYGTIGATADDYQMSRLTRGKGDMHMYHAEMGYEHRFGDKHKLVATLSYNRWMSDNDNTYHDSTTYATPLRPTAYSYQLRPMHVRNRATELKIDYENQLADNWKLEAGYNGRLSHENTPQESFADLTWDGISAVEDEAYYNRFIYDIGTHALYATVHTSVGPLGIMAGLRGEYWHVDTESRDFWQENDADLRQPHFKKDYFQLFPSLFLNYQLTPTTQLQLNYTRRLRRPWGGQLNSFRNTRDASMVEFGNPELTPEYTNSFSLNFLKTWTEHTLSISTYYRPTTDVIQRIRYQDADDGLMYMTFRNVSKNQSAGVEIIGKNKLWRILDLTTTLNGYYYKVDGFSYDIDGQTVTGEGDKSFSWDARLLGSLILPRSITLQLTGNYRSRGVITQGYRKPNASLDLGLRKTFFDRKFALAFNWRDVFNTRHWENYTSGPTFNRHQKNWRDPRVNIQLTWNFGNMNNNRNRPGQGQGDLQQGDYEQQQPNNNYGADQNGAEE